MNHNHLTRLCQYFNLGQSRQAPERIHGGLLHLMWRIDTDKGSYAIKQLSKDIDLTDERIVKNYELSEHIARGFAAKNIPALCAIAQFGNYLFMTEDTGYLVYPWVDAKSLDSQVVSKSHALKIAAILAKMHQLNLDEPDLPPAHFYTYTQEQIVALIDKTKQFDCPFSENLWQNLDNILAANEAYQKAMPILKTHIIVTHGDLDQKNVLWDSDNNPILIDWESACKINPTYDIINTAFYWSGITSDFDKALFFKMIHTYQQAGGVINKEHIVAAIGGVFSWIGWLVYNINRSCVAGDSEQKSMGITQVNETLATILRLQIVMPEVINLIEVEL
ncbi:MAG: aminoglycoside phosphotransferase family protein [Gammaproteobacteria bacterium]|nr:aminoglycoside phosphotransferase family protein [Gammaproteobacteria bacterium]